MPETTVLGGSVSNVTVYDSGVNPHTLLNGQFGKSLKNLMNFVNSQKPGGSNHPDAINANGPTAIGTRDAKPSPATVLMPGKGGGSLSLRNIIGNDAHSMQNIVDSTGGGHNRIAMQQGNIAVIGNAIGDTISAVGNLTVTGGQSQHISAGGSLQFIDGTGTSYVSAHDAIIYGTSNSTYYFIGTDDKAVTHFYGAVDPSKGNGSDGVVHNILFDASSSHGALLAEVGNQDTIIGGTGADTFIVGSNIVASGPAEQRAATITGGSGAANLFEFIDNQGGRYTITDFSNAKGNKVAFKGSQKDLDDALAHATVEGGNTTIRLKDKTEITFLNDDHITKNDFNLL